jgi:hypothetical protein
MQGLDTQAAATADEAYTIDVKYLTATRLATTPALALLLAPVSCAAVDGMRAAAAVAHS